ncbi:sulfite exporter TauE/SafE family protein [Ornithinibacillus halotolerans]|uniref:Probable membrane transporter protein n=1 Tax=Ornithinibacillus halotolerans TaxID=1274357 RepID=A0A916RXQ9_9BACI|nr:sulfite exporter TauE/SafE family protein [Ornithinibacillus halotolerans]GGA75828.1 UPF0721 transmembrane protein YjnA [Ornithinibacillus halotolerans]
MNVEFIFVGFIVGILIGLAGVGGASILTPLLIFMGIPPSTAIGTDFLYNSITKAFGTWQHFRQKTINITIVKYLSLGSLPTAIIANFLFHYYLIDYYNERLILLILGIVLLTISLVTLIQILFQIEVNNRWKEKTVKDKKVLLISFGVCIGTIVGITSVGAGSLVALFLLYFFHIKSSKLVGTDIAHAFILTSIPGILMASYGHVNLALLLLLICGSIPGSIIGSKLTLKFSSKHIRILILVIIVISGIKLIF